MLGRPYREPADSPRRELLLKKLAEALGGHRVVSGTLAAINEDCFDCNGLIRYVALERLFSSVEALKVDPPQYHDRLVSLEQHAHA